MRAASEARQFSGETWRVLTNLPKEQVGKIIAAALSQALWATFHSKKNAIREAGKLTVKLGKQIWVYLTHEACTLNEERELYLQNIGPRFERTGRIWRRALRKNALSKLAAFRALSLAEKKDIVVSGFLWLGTFFLVGGGLDFEGGAPDLDIKVGGIGQHRNLISHTILLGLFLEFLLRLAVGLFRAGKEYLPQEKSLIWKQVEKIAIFLEKNENVLVSGMWYRTCRPPAEGCQFRRCQNKAVYRHSFFNANRSAPGSFCRQFLFLLLVRQKPSSRKRTRLISKHKHLLTLNMNRKNRRGGDAG